MTTDKAEHISTQIYSYHNKIMVNFCQEHRELSPPNVIVDLVICRYPSIIDNILATVDSLNIIKPKLYFM